MLHPQDPIRGKLLLGYQKQLLDEMAAHNQLPDSVFRMIVRRLCTPRRRPHVSTWAQELKSARSTR